MWRRIIRKSMHNHGYLVHGLATCCGNGEYGFSQALVDLIISGRSIKTALFAIEGPSAKVSVQLQIGSPNSFSHICRPQGIVGPWAFVR